MNEQKSTIKKQNGTKRKQKARDKAQSKSVKKVKDKKIELKKSSKKETGAQNRSKSEGKKSKKEESKDIKQPKRSWPAFFFFQNETRSDIKKNNPELSQKDLVSKLGEVWRGLSEEEKKPYFDQERKDKARYMKEKEEYSKVTKNIPGNKTKGRKGKQKTVKLGPKRAWPPFFFYQEQRREDLKKENPNLNHKEIVSKLGEEWRGLSEKEKHPFVEKSASDQKRYEVEKKEYQSSLPEEQKQDISNNKAKSSTKNPTANSKEKVQEKAKSKKAKKTKKAVKPAVAPKRNVKQPKPPVRPAGGRHSKRIKQIEEEQYMAEVQEYTEHKGLNEEEAKKLLLTTLPKENEDESEPKEVVKPEKVEKKAAPKAKAAAKDSKKSSSKATKHETDQPAEKDKEIEPEQKDAEMEPQDAQEPEAEEKKEPEIKKGKKKQQKAEAEPQEKAQSGDEEMAPEAKKDEQVQPEKDVDMEPEKPHEEPEKEETKKGKGSKKKGMAAAKTPSKTAAKTPVKKTEEEPEEAEEDPEANLLPEPVVVKPDSEVHEEPEKKEENVEPVEENLDTLKPTKQGLSTPQKHKSPLKSDGKRSPLPSPKVGGSKEEEKSVVPSLPILESANSQNDSKVEGDTKVAENTTTEVPNPSDVLPVDTENLNVDEQKKD